MTDSDRVLSNGVTYQRCNCCGKPISRTGKAASGVLCLVLKDFIRNSARVPLVDNTVKLLEHIGFKVEYRIKAWLTETHGAEDMFTGQRKKRSRKSFFRRLHEKRYPHLAIDFEEVIVAVKEL